MITKNISVRFVKTKHTYLTLSSKNIYGYNLCKVREDLVFLQRKIEYFTATF